MNFMPEEGFCCTFVENWSSSSEYDSRIWSFLSWIKSLPAYSGHYGGRPTASTAATLTDQPFVIKIVEDGYAFMFRGAFALRQEQSENGGFDRIPYFELVTSQFKELPFSGDACVAIVCEAHDKRYLLNLYLKDPPNIDRGLEPLEKLQKSTENVSQPEPISFDDATHVVDITSEKVDATDVVSTKNGNKNSEVPDLYEQSLPTILCTDTWI